MGISMSEAEFQQRITDLCDLLGLKWHHEVDSRKSKGGFPDLVIAGRGVIFAELKKQDGRTSPEQREWARQLIAAGAEFYFWRPSDWDSIHQRLRKLAGR